MALESGRKQGRRKVVGKIVRPESSGRIIVFRTTYTTDVDPVSHELEEDLLRNASSSTMRSIFEESIAEARGAKPKNGADHDN